MIIIQFWTAGRAILHGYSPYDQVFEAATQQANGWDIRWEPMPFQPYFYPPWLPISMWLLALLLFLTGTIWALDTGPERLAGICMWLLTIKPHIGLIVVVVVSLKLLAQRRWRPLISVTRAVVVYVIAAFVVTSGWRSVPITYAA